MRFSETKLLRCSRIQWHFCLSLLSTRSECTAFVLVQSCTWRRIETKTCNMPKKSTMQKKNICTITREAFNHSLRFSTTGASPHPLGRCSEYHYHCELFLQAMSIQAYTWTANRHSKSQKGDYTVATGKQGNFSAKCSDYFLLPRRKGNISCNVSIFAHHNGTAPKRKRVEMSSSGKIRKTSNTISCSSNCNFCSRT